MARTGFSCVLSLMFIVSIVSIGLYYFVQMEPEHPVSKYIIDAEKSIPREHIAMIAQSLNDAAEEAKPHLENLKKMWDEYKSQNEYAEPAALGTLGLTFFIFLFSMVMRARATQKAEGYMVVNTMTEEEFDNSRREYTRQALQQLMSTSEWKDHVRKRGTKVENYIWQRRTADTETSETVSPRKAPVDGESTASASPNPAPAVALEHAQPPAIAVGSHEHAE